MLPENQKAKQGGISFDVILKPAASDNVKSPVQVSSSAVKKRELSQEQIENKLKKAEERRSVRRVHVHDILQLLIVIESFVFVEELCY